MCALVSSTDIDDSLGGDFLKTLDWFWHYDPDLDSMFLMGQAQVCMYIFFCRPFSINILSPQFDPEILFDGVPLHMVHPVFDLPPPLPILDMEMNLVEVSSLLLASSHPIHPPHLEVTR